MKSLTSIVFPISNKSPSIKIISPLTKNKLSLFVFIFNTYFLKSSKGSIPTKSSKVGFASITSKAKNKINLDLFHKVSSSNFFFFIYFSF